MFLSLGHYNVKLFLKKKKRRRKKCGFYTFRVKVSCIELPSICIIYHIAPTIIAACSTRCSSIWMSIFEPCWNTFSSGDFQTFSISGTTWKMDLSRVWNRSCFYKRGKLEGKALSDQFEMALCQSDWYSSYIYSIHNIYSI